MDLDDSVEDAAFRREARTWIAANAPCELRIAIQRSAFGYLDIPGADTMALQRAWQKKKFDAGWACIGWPRIYGGRGASAMQQVIWQQEEGIFGKLSGVFLVGHGMCGPTLLAYASEDQKRRLLPPLASGEEIWCQLFSEPVAGSDLAGLRTRAEICPGGWRVTGQKIWTSEAQHASWGLLLARSDSAREKHKGLTMMFLDMKSPGIAVRPIRQMNDQYVFNEVFFDNVFVPQEQTLGRENEGWGVALTTLMNERLSVGLAMPTGFEEFLDYVLARPDSKTLARELTARIARWSVRAGGLKFTALQAISRLSKGELPGPENSIGKLVAGAMMQDIARTALDLQGANGVLTSIDEAPASAQFQSMLLRSPATRIEGGTDQILTNIIAERVLGLPPDMRADKGLAFNAIPTAG